MPTESGCRRFDPQQRGVARQRIAVGQQTERIELRRIVQQRRLHSNQPRICGVASRRDPVQLLLEIGNGSQLRLCPPVQLLPEGDRVFTLAGQQVIEHPVAAIEHVGRAFSGIVEGAGHGVVRVLHERGPVAAQRELPQEVRHAPARRTVAS